MGKIMGVKLVEGSEEEMKEGESVMVWERYGGKVLGNGNGLGWYV